MTEFSSDYYVAGGFFFFLAGRVDEACCYSC